MSIAELFSDSPPAFPLDGIQRASVDAIMTAPEFPALIAEYARECSTAGLPTPNAKMATYRAIERTGTLHAFAAIESGSLVGFIVVLAPILPHYGVTVAVCESFFVAADHRRGGVGLKLLARAEALTREIGSPGLLVSAPVGSRLAELLPRCGYRETNRVFFKEVTDA